MTRLLELGVDAQILLMKYNLKVQDLKPGSGGSSLHIGRIH